jgi:hypothetical protein
MPHYNFCFTNGERVCYDADGLDLADDESARREAELAACDLRDDPGEGDWSGWIVEVTDENGRRITSIAVSASSKAVKFESDPPIRL